MKKYNLKFEFWNINVDPIKEKEANKIIWILSQTRHVKDLSFANYGEMTFDPNDDNHWKPIVEHLMVFNRRKSNCMVFDIHLTKGIDYYDKLSCTLSSITTINKLKEEFPEAYNIYVKLYGEPGAPCKKAKDDTGNETSMCDNIEKLRAEYNKVVDNKVVDNKEVDKK